MVSKTKPSPFHAGEQAIQTRLGVRDRTEMLGQKMIRDHMPDQHRAFFAQLPMLFIGACDESGAPWASLLQGSPGFISAPDPTHLEIAAQLSNADPLAKSLSPGAPIGVLGIEYTSRRRNRISTRVQHNTGGKLVLEVEQSFGNCPQYIQARRVVANVKNDAELISQDSEDFTQLTTESIALIERADNFYIATSHSDTKKTSGADVSHRGGKPGFVRVLDDSNLEFPDYSGNNHFSTLGNISLNGKAGLTFIDFDNGDVYYLTGDAEINWKPLAADAARGAKRTIRFRMTRGRTLRCALPVRWEFESYAPRLP